MINEKGGLLGPQGRARDQGRRLQPEHGRLRLQRADLGRQGRPAARHVLVAAEPARLGGRRARADALRRAGGRQPGHLQPRLQDGVLLPAGDGRPPGRHVGELDRRRCRRTRGRRRRRTRRSTTRSRRRPPRASRTILKEAGIQTVYRKTYTGDQKNFDAIAAAVKAKNPDLIVAGTQFEDGIGFMRALSKVNFTPKWLYQTNAPSFGDQYLEGIGAEKHRGRLLRGQPQPGVRHARQPRVRGQVQGDVRRRERARGRGRRLRGGAGPAGHGRGQQDRREGGPAQAGRLAARQHRCRRSSAT